MTVAQSRVLRVGAIVGAVLLVLTFVMRGYTGFHPDLIHALMYPVPAVVVVALAGWRVGGRRLGVCLRRGEGQILPHRGRFHFRLERGLTLEHPEIIGQYHWQTP